MQACGWCGNDELEPGFIEEARLSGFTRWVQGALVRGPTGNAKRAGLTRWVVTAHRCLRCGHLEHFATEPERGASRWM